jgi:hypothetical protein
MLKEESVATKMITKLVCPKGCKRKAGQPIEYKRLGWKKAKRTDGAGRKIAVMVLATVDGHYTTWHCPVCGTRLEKKKVRETIRPSKKVMRKIKNKRGGMV